MTNTIAIIPARGGSKRIPKKNLVPFMGKPMIAHTIQAALESERFSSVYVSTDSEEIAEVSREFGAVVPFLREENADDFSTVSDVILSMMNKLMDVQAAPIDTVSALLPNCPLRDSKDICNALDAFQEKKRHFQISAFNYGWLNPWWAHTINGDGQAEPVFSDLDKRARSQDLRKVYCPTGAIWIADVPSLFEARTFYGPEYCFHVMDWKNAVDIDDYQDLEMAKLLYNFV